MALNTNASISDWLKSNGQDNSYSNRAKLYQQYGINGGTGYAGSAQQNTAMLNYFQQNGLNSQAAQTKQTTAAPKAPVAQTQWYNNTPDNIAKWYFDFSRNVQNGNADWKQYGDYVNEANKYGLQIYKPNEDALRNLSLKALSGDTSAADYLKHTNATALTGGDLWKGYDPTKQAFASNGVEAQYLKDNPDAQYSIDYDTRHKKLYDDMIINDKPMNDWQTQWYQDMIKRRNFEDMNDPYVQQRNQLEKDKQGALDAQDVALNQGLTTMDSNSFNQFQQVQQQMQDRGMSNSGIAQDAYMRSQMANNANYQQQYAESATTKSDIQSQFNSAISDSKLGQREYEDSKAAAAAANETKLAEIQSNQDKWMTETTGSLYINGQQIIVNGKPITTVEYEKMSESQRHNLATEALTGQKNAQDYALGVDSNNVKREGIAADLQTSLAKIKLDSAKLDYNYAKLDANNSIAQSKIQIAISQAQNSTDKTQLSALGKQSGDLAKQIIAQQKLGDKGDKKALKNLVDKYNEVNNSISSIIGKANFNDSSEGSGSSGSTSTSSWSSGSNYSNWKRYGKQPAAFNSQMNTAITKGVPSSEAKALTELIGRESSWNSTAKNPNSTAYGYGQFLKATRASYESKTGLSYSDPVNQIVMTYQYVKDRYGNATKALQFWDKNNWY